MLVHWIEIIVNGRIILYFIFDRPTTILFLLSFEILSVLVFLYSRFASIHLDSINRCVCRAVFLPRSLSLYCLSLELLRRYCGAWDAVEEHHHQTEDGKLFDFLFRFFIFNIFFCAAGHPSVCLAITITDWPIDERWRRRFALLT